MRTKFNKPNIILCFSAFLLFFSQISNAQTLSLQLTPTHINCFGGQTGAIDLVVTGGTAPYTYLWSNEAQTEDLADLPAGYYHITVTDANQQTDEAEITLTEPTQIKILLDAYLYPNEFNISQNGSCNGNVSATVNGGVTPYTYLWHPGQQTITNPTNLCAGEVSITVTDNNGCLQRESIVLSQPEKDSWLTSGNSVSDPQTQYIGTVNVQDFVLKTNGVERMRFKSDGNIAMPSTSHFETLRVNRITSPDTVLYIGDSTILYMKMTNNLTADQSGTPPFNIYKGIGFGQFSYAKGANAIGMGYNARAEGDNSFAFGNNLFVPNTTNNSFIIGTGVSPTDRLVNNSIKTLYIGFDSNIPTVVVTAASGIGTTGSVGIGIDPTGHGVSGPYKLLVNGKFGSKESYVSLGAPWPDYVFKKGYRLLSLEEIQDFVLENHHLQGMPSAKEMEEGDGINLGDIQTRTVKIVEELYLQVIKLNKRLKALEKKNEILENELKNRK